jgi:hypothetical protein
MKTKKEKKKRQTMKTKKEKKKRQKKFRKISV